MSPLRPANVKEASVTAGRFAPSITAVNSTVPSCVSALLIATWEAARRLCAAGSYSPASVCSKLTTSGSVGSSEPLPVRMRTRLEPFHLIGVPSEPTSTGRLRSMVPDRSGIPLRSTRKPVRSVTSPARPGPSWSSAEQSAP